MKANLRVPLMAFFGVTLFLCFVAAVDVLAAGAATSMQSTPKPAVNTGPVSISRISPETVQRVKRQFTTEPSQLLAGLATAIDRSAPPLMDAVSGVAEALYSTMAAQEQFMQMLSVCSMRPFTRDEQEQAGCKGSDTLSQCEDKLMSWCMKAKREALVAAYGRIQQKASALKGELQTWKTLMPKTTQALQGVCYEGR